MQAFSLVFEKRVNFFVCFFFYLLRFMYTLILPTLDKTVRSKCLQQKVLMLENLPLTSLFSGICVGWALA